MTTTPPALQAEPEQPAPKRRRTRSTKVRHSPTAAEVQDANMGSFPPPTPWSERMAVENVDLVRERAQRISARTRMPYDDLFAAGWVGLLNACRRYDPERRQPSGIPYKISSVAVPFIEGAMKRFLRDKGFAVRFPNCWRELSPRVRRLNGEGLSNAAIAEQLGIPVQEVAEMLGAMGPVAELQHELVGGPLEVAEEESDDCLQDLLELAGRAWKRLHPDDRAYFEAYWANPRRITFPTQQMQQFRGAVRRLVGDRRAPGGVQRTELGFEVMVSGFHVRRGGRRVAAAPADLEEVAARAEQLGLFSLLAGDLGEPEGESWTSR